MSTAKCAHILECMLMEEIRYATLENDHIGTLSTYVINGWLSLRTEVKKEKIQTYWPFQDDTVVVDQTVMNCRRVIVPAS